MRRAALSFPNISLSLLGWDGQRYDADANPSRSKMLSFGDNTMRSVRRYGKTKWISKTSCSSSLPIDCWEFNSNRKDPTHSVSLDDHRKETVKNATVPHIDISFKKHVLYMLIFKNTWNFLCIFVILSFLLTEFCWRRVYKIEGVWIVEVN